MSTEKQDQEMSAEKQEKEMSAWQINSFDGWKELKLSKVMMPEILLPSDVIVKVDATSVNPIDVYMTKGYGSQVINISRKIKKRKNPHISTDFPLIFGRDFAGTIVSKGSAVTNVEIGDEVWGVLPIEPQGCHATHVAVDSSLVNRRPKNITSIEAASILYVGLTAWSALWFTGGLAHETEMTPAQKNKKILILGGSGGVGIVAIQLLKAWNLRVVTTCSTDAVDMVQKLGPDVVVDYKSSDADSKVIAEGPYDIVLDCAGQGFEDVKSKGYPHSTYISLNSPLLHNFDNHGIFLGGMRNLGDFLWRTTQALKGQSSLKYGFYTPSPKGIKLIQDLVEANKMVPIVQEIFSFDDLPKAYEKVEKGHLRGKIVVSMR